MSTTEKIFQEQQKVIRNLRNAYVQLRGADFIWAKQSELRDRRDFYGDIEHTDIVVTEEPIKVVLIDVSDLTLIDTWINNQNGTEVNLDSVTYKGMIELGVAVQKGDLLKVPFQDPDTLTDVGLTYYPFRIVDVKEVFHKLAITKQIHFTPFY